jgi:hypothetical protein
MLRQLLLLWLRKDLLVATTAVEAVVRDRGRGVAILIAVVAAAALRDGQVGGCGGLVEWSAVARTAHQVSLYVRLRGMPPLILAEDNSTAFKLVGRGEGILDENIQIFSQ